MPIGRWATSASSSAVHSGPDSAYWDGWFSVTRTRDGHPLSGKVMNGRLVQVLGSRS